MRKSSRLLVTGAVVAAVGGLALWVIMSAQEESDWSAGLDVYAPLGAWAVIVTGVVCALVGLVKLWREPTSEATPSLPR